MNRRQRHGGAALAQGVLEGALEAHHRSCLAMLRSLLVARRSVLTDRVAAMAEEMRAEHIGVTVLSFEKARFPEGWSWWEWNPRTEGRRSLSCGPLDFDRAGVLVATDPTGQRGTMHFVYSGVNNRGGRVLETGPIACAFDWREAYESPPTFEQRPTVEDYRDVLAHSPPDAPLGELEASPVFLASLDRRFGFVENRFFDAGSRGGARPDGRRDTLELFLQLNHAAMNEAMFVLALMLVVGSAPLAVTPVAPGVQLARDAAGTDPAPFDCAVLDLAPRVFPEGAA